MKSIKTSKPTKEVQIYESYPSTAMDREGIEIRQKVPSVENPRTIISHEIQQYIQRSRTKPKTTKNTILVNQETRNSKGLEDRERETMGFFFFFLLKRNHGLLTW
jgi:hypothetical protein